MLNLSAPLACLLAAAPPQSQSLDFDTARALARERWPAVRAGELAAQAARSSARAAGRWDDPMLGVQVWQLPLNQFEDPLRPGMSATERAMMFGQGPMMFPLMVMASQSFPWPGKKGAESDEAHAVAAQRSAEAEGMRADVDRAVAYAYAEAGATARTIEITRESMALLDAMIPMAESRVAAGTGSPSDVLSLRSDRQALEKDIIDMEWQQSVARARLAAMTGGEKAGDVLQQPVSVTVPPRDELLRAALDKRPDLRAARASTRAAEARARRATLDAFPDVTASASYMVQTGGVGTLMDRGPWEALLGPSDMVSFGVSIPVPLQFPFKQGRATEAARLDARRALEEVRSREQLAALEIDENLAAIDHALRHEQLHQHTLIPLAAQQVELARAAWMSGRGDAMGFIGATRTLRAHHGERVAAELEYARHVADLERITGLPLVRFRTATPETPATSVDVETPVNPILEQGGAP